MRRPRATLVAAMLAPLFLLAATHSPAQEGQAANPPYKNWSAFKSGASVTLKTVVVDKSGDNPGAVDATARPDTPSERLITYKLVQSTPEKAVVEMTQTEIEPGSETEHAAVRITYPAKVGKKTQGQTLPKSKIDGFKEGEEEVEVEGKKVKCRWAESEIKVGDETSTSKLWWSEDIPGGTVKQITSKKQGGKLLYEATTTLVSVKGAR